MSFWTKGEIFTPLFDCFLGSDWVDPDDPLMIAEAELLGAANSIEAASRKLALLQPRKKPKVIHPSNANTLD